MIEKFLECKVQFLGYQLHKRTDFSPYKFRRVVFHIPMKRSCSIVASFGGEMQNFMRCTQFACGANGTSAGAQHAGAEFTAKYEQGKAYELTRIKSRGKVKLEITKSKRRSTEICGTTSQVAHPYSRCPR
jgi:hypothetical protein